MASRILSVLIIILWLTAVTKEMIDLYTLELGETLLLARDPQAHPGSMNVVGTQAAHLLDREADYPE